MPTLEQQFGLVIRQQREAARLSQEAFAARAGLHRTYISLLERGRRIPTLRVLRQLAKGLDTTMTALVRKLEESLD